MITIKKLAWSNWFSYGENNFIDFEQPVLQIMGKNGSGKTSIPLILQEVFYGKNSKGKKKASLVNRYLDKPTVSAECEFYDNDNQYKINLSRKTTLKLTLTKNGEDISSHTTTGTYKTIQNIIGLDFKTFSQLVYQSSTDNLEFLTATDANRKKFLITLFALDKYIGIQEQFKKVASELNTEFITLNSKISTIESWIKTNEKLDFTTKNIEELPEIDDEDINKLGETRTNLTNIVETNIKVNKNNQYKKLLEGLDTSLLYENIVYDRGRKIILVKESKDLKNDIIRNETSLKLLNTTKTKIKALGDTCHSCRQEITEDLKETMLREVEEEECSIDRLCTDLNETLQVITSELLELRNISIKLSEKEKVSEEVSKLSLLIDKTVPKEIFDERELKRSILEISNRIDSIKATISKVSKSNTVASAHNSRIEVVLKQLEEHREEIDTLTISANKLADTLNKVEIIKKAFSPSGLLSYKIDFLVKDLEKEINEYLGTLSDGKFQLIFKLENEKLNIEIIDEGMSVGIEELSAGELARINAATLLAIRKLMAAISSTKINILFLDEIMGVLDDSGKEMLIEVLHKEKDLNTLLVSHEYSHPLIPKITIIKDNKISRIDNG